MLFRSSRVVIGPLAELARSWLIADESNWLVDFPIGAILEGEVQIRYNSGPEPARVERLSEKQFRVDFRDPSYAVSPGQLAAVFTGSRALGCGWIRKTG